MMLTPLTHSPTHPLVPSISFKFSHLFIIFKFLATGKKGGSVYSNSLQSIFLVCVFSKQSQTMFFCFPTSKCSINERERNSHHSANKPISFCFLPKLKYFSIHAILISLGKERSFCKESKGKKLSTRRRGKGVTRSKW